MGNKTTEGGSGQIEVPVFTAGTARVSIERGCQNRKWPEGCHAEHRIFSLSAKICPFGMPYVYFLLRLSSLKRPVNGMPILGLLRAN